MSGHVSGHHPWSQIRRKRLRKKGKCDKVNIDGSICERFLGTCIHTYIPTRFGQQSQEGRND